MRPQLSDLGPTLTPMQTTVSEAELHDQFFELIEQVESGGEVLITRSGIPIARITPFISQVSDTQGTVGGRG